jgi:hypothetical protein
MLSYYDQYQIVNGIFFTFTENRTKRGLSVSHTQKKIDSLKKKFPYQKYEQFTKENFIVLNLYIQYHLSPSSVQDVLRHLLELDFQNDVMPFKNDIVNYRAFLSAQIKHLRDSYGKPTVEDVFDAYRKKKISFYTLWFYLIYSGYDLYKSFEGFSRIQVRELQKIKNLLLYVTFSEKSLEYIKVLFSETDLLS